MSEVNETSVDKVKSNVAGGETAKTTATSSKGKSVNDNKQSNKANKARIIRNFTYALNDVENVFTSKMSFFLEELNKQLNALINSNIYIENKENLDKVIKSKGEFRKELLRLLKSTKYKDFYQKYYFEAEIFGNKAKYFRTVIEEYRRILLSRLHRQTIIDMIVNNPNITYQEVFNKLCDMNEQSGSNSATHYKFNWISKAEFNNIVKQLNNLANLDKLSSLENLTSVAVSEASETASKASVADVYAIDYSSEDDQISEFNLTDNDEYYLIEFRLKYSDYTTQSDSLLTYQCQVPKKQIKGLTTGYTKLEKFTRPRIYLRDLREDTDITNSDSPSLTATQHKLYISFNYELSPCSVVQQAGVQQATATDDTWQFKTMGIDIGVAKSATAAIMTTNMCWVASESSGSGSDSNSEGGAKTKAEVKQQSNQAEIKLVPAIDFTQPVAISNELTISDKTKSVSEHIEILKEEQNYIYKKEKAIASLLKLKQFDGNASNAINAVDELVNLATPTLGESEQQKLALQLRHKYQRLNELRLHLRHKVSNLKKELSFLTARDMISHAIDNEVDLITMEKLSWISDADAHHTTWDYNQIQQRIIHEANIYGIKVKKVSCAYSSAHNPLTLEKEEVDQNRKLVKCLFDRDYAAAIILARRGVKLGKRKLKLCLQAKLKQKQLCKQQQINSHINESFHAVNYSIKPSLKYRQLKLCEPKPIISGIPARSERCYASEADSNFAYYSIL